MDDLLILRPKLRGEDGCHTFSIRVKKELLERIDRISDDVGYSRNGLIGILLEYAMDHCQLAP